MVPKEKPKFFHLQELSNVHHKKLDRFSLWAIFFIFFMVVFGGILQIRSSLFATQRNVFDPITKKLTELYQKDADAYLLGNDEAQALADLQTKDTDKDGLNDFEEQSIHNTSPYLADTDSDGLSDQQELTQGTNPNCVEGQPCSLQGGESVAGSEVAAAAAFQGLSPEAQNFLPRDEAGNVDVAQVRQLLAQYGVPEDLLNQTSDEDLIRLFEDTFKQIGSGTNVQANLEAQIDTLRKLPANEKRAYLVQVGLSKSEVDALSDEQLNTIFDEAINQALTDLNQQQPEAEETEEGSEQTTSEQTTEESQNE